MAEELDEATLTFAHRMFELARSGETEVLVQQLDADHPDVVALLRGGGPVRPPEG